MKKRKLSIVTRFALVSVICLLFAGCSENENPNTNGSFGPTSGKIVISGDEVDLGVLMSPLPTGFARTTSSANQNYLLIVNEGSTIAEPVGTAMTPVHADDNNWFSLYIEEASQGTIVALTFKSGDEDGSYGCATVAVGNNAVCGGSVDFDFSGNTISFNNLILMENNKELTLNGSLSW